MGVVIFSISILNRKFDNVIFKKVIILLFFMYGIVMEQPVLMEVYRDPETNNEMLIIFASLHGGVTQVTSVFSCRQWTRNFHCQNNL
jgi:hypothetical protein